MPTYQVRTIEWAHMSCWLDRWPRSTDSTLVSTHATYAEAVSACDAVNAAAWADPAFNPFLYGGESLFFQTTLPAGPFRDFLQDRGLDVPRSDITNTGWVRWYKSRRAKLTDAHRVAVREALNLVRFAEVVEVPDGAAKVYVLQRRTWSHNYESSSRIDAGGGSIVAAYWDRARAEARGDELNGDVDFYDVEEIDAIGLASRSGHSFPVVYRRVFNSRYLPMEYYQQRDCTTPVAVRAYADRAAADAHAAELMRVARRTLNPLVALPSPPRAVLARALRFQSPFRPRDKRGRVIWNRWYGIEAAHLTDEQRAKVWSLFDDLPLYGVTDVPWGE